MVLAVLSHGDVQAQVKRNISIDSNCPKALRLYISHADGYRNWHVHGPFQFAPNEGPTKLKDNGVVLTQSENHDLYVYAESLDGKTSWSGDYSFEFNGLTFGMMKAALSLVNGEVRVNLTCN
jgi:hypothetical protein